MGSMNMYLSTYFFEKSKMCLALESACNKVNKFQDDTAELFLVKRFAIKNECLHLLFLMKFKLI